MREKKLPSIYLIPTLIISVCLLFIVAVALYLSYGYELARNAVADRVKAPYEVYGITLPETFTRTFSYASEAGFHGDKCTAVKYKTGGDESLFSDFTDGADTGAESQMNFVLKSADVPENVHPDYSQSYRWKLLDNDDDRLVIIYFPDQETVYFGEAIM